MLQQYIYTTAVPQHNKAVDLAKQYHQVARSLDDPLQVYFGHTMMAITSVFTGAFNESHGHCQQVFKIYDKDLHHPIAYSAGQDPGVFTFAFDFYNLWYLGYPDQALELSEYTIAFAEDLGHDLTYYHVLCLKSRLHRWRREAVAVQAFLNRQQHIWEKTKMHMAEAGVLLDTAWVLSEKGEPHKAIPIYEEGLEKWHATGMMNHRSEFLDVLAEIYGKAGNPQRGLEIVDEALDFVERSHEFYHHAELYRLRGLLTLQQDATQTQQAESDFRKSIQTARDMDAKMCELRGATCLAELLLQAGDVDQAYAVLSPIYAWFTEGFDLRDLQEAKALLDEIETITYIPSLE